MISKVFRILLVVALIAGYLYMGGTPDQATPPTTGSIEAAFEGRLSNTIVTAEGEVTRLLPDDNEGSRHQKFIVTLASGTTILISHNIDLAPRIENLERGDHVTFKGEYEWNDRGGVVHWTHHDPADRHEGGWIQHDGRRYE